MILSYAFVGDVPIMQIMPVVTFNSTDAVCDWLADLPVSTRWAIIEGMMRKSLIDMKADTQAIKGERAKDGVVWLLLATESKELIDAVVPILEKR